MGASALDELEIQGMTCAACASRVERRLNDLEGVQASVNPATERATVRFDAERVSHAALVGAVEAAGYRVAPPARRALGRRLAVAVALGAPTMAAAMAGASGWLQLVLATPVVLWAGLPFHRAAVTNLRHGGVTMDTLISLGTLAAYVWSLVAVARGDGHLYFEVAAVITALVLLGRWLEAGARRRSAAAVGRLLELGAKEARVLRDGVEVSLPAEELAVGDLFVVRPGERIAADGIVVDGSSAVDASMLTGEPVPDDVVPGDEVAGGTVNTSGRLLVRAARVGAETALAQITRLVAEAQAGKAPAQRLADRVSAVFVPVVVALSLLTFGGWLLAGSVADAFTAGVAVLVIACPCALGLATPTALLVGTGRGAQIGVLIRGPQVLESTRRATTVVLDKTGTVTEGRLALAGIELLDGATRSDVLRLAGAVELASEHPVGRAVAEAARFEVGALPAVESFHAEPGSGVRGIVEGHDVEVGRSQHGILVRWDGADRALLRVTDVVRPTSATAVAELRRLGLSPVLLTGDDESTAHDVAGAVGIERVVAGVRPDEKVLEIHRLQADGEVVAMVGDGVNDAPALAAADLGIAIGSGSDIAIEASDLTLLSSDLRAVVDAIRLARRTLATIRGNLFWAFAYNVAALPLAVAGVLSPLVAAGAMAFSSLFVVGNSLRLKRFRSVRA